MKYDFSFKSGADIMHKPFVCKGCRASLNGMNAAGRGGKASEDFECYTVCAYCGAVYVSRVKPIDIAMGIEPEWEPVADADLDGSLRKMQAMARAGKVKVPRSARVWRPS